MNRIFVDGEMVVASPETASIEEILAALVGKSEPLRHNPLVLVALESLGESFAAVLMTSTAVFSPVGQDPLTYDKPPGWGSLGPWSVFAAGGGSENGQPYVTFTMAFDDPDAAERNLDEIRDRVKSYKTLVPERLSDSPALAAGWPEYPLDEACSSLSVEAARWPFGSAISVQCQTQFNLIWTQMVNLRDLGFLLP